MRRSLDKVGRVFVRVKTKQLSWKTQAIFSEKLEMCRFLENRARIGQKIQYADFKANSGGFQSESKMFRFFEQTHATFGQKFESAEFWAKLDFFFGELSAKSGIWMKCSHRSHDVRTICFFQAVCSHGFSHFARFFFAGMFARLARLRTMFARRP